MRSCSPLEERKIGSCDIKVTQCFWGVLRIRQQTGTLAALLLLRSVSDFPEAWLWLFYAHLVALYMVAGLTYAEVTPVIDPIESINARVDAEHT
eukprot:5811174-Amphidinium_carterae.3